MAKSLAAEANIVPTSTFGAGGGEIEVAGPQFVISNYIVFAHPNSKTLYPRILAAISDVEEGDPVLIQPDPLPPVALSPFKFYLVHAWQHFSKVDDNGNITKSTLDADKAAADYTWKEHIETVLVVVTEAKLAAARCTFKTTKVNAAHAAIRTLKEIKDKPQDWAKKSGDHQATLSMPEAWMRFLATVRLKKGTGRASGKAYVAANASTAPTTPGDWKRLKEFFENTANAKMCDTLVAQYRQRVSEVKAKMV